MLPPKSTPCKAWQRQGLWRPSSPSQQLLGVSARWASGPFLSLFSRKLGCNLASMDELPGACQPLKFYAKVMGRCTLSMCSGLGPQCSSDAQRVKPWPGTMMSWNDSLQMEQGSGAGRPGHTYSPPPAWAALYKSLAPLSKK